MQKMMRREVLAWVFLTVFVVVGPLVLVGCVVPDANIGDNAPEEQTAESPDAGLAEKAVCTECLSACKTMCYHQRYNEAHACTSYVSYSYCVNQCSATKIPQLEQACTSQYLAYANCVNTSPSPVFQCVNNISLVRESWRCSTQANALSWCRLLN